MKILFFIDGFRRGGKERRLLELLKEIEGKNIDYQVVVIHPETEYEIPSEIRCKIIHIKKSRKKDLSPFIEFFKICKSYNPDIIHTWSSMVTFYSIPSKILSGKILLNSQITDAPPYLKRWTSFWFICKINFLFSNLILSNSHAGLLAYNISEKKSKVIYNGIDLKRFKIIETKEEIKKRIGLSTKYCVVMVATFSENKDYITYIQVASEVQKIRTDITFLAIGNGKNFERCKEYASELKLSNFKFFGSRDDIERILKACDIGVLFSPNGEGLSNAIIECLAIGLPVIANNIGGNSEIIKNNFNGFLIADNLKENAYHRIISILDNNDLRIGMGQNAYLSIKKRFSVGRMFQEFLDTYNNLLLKR